MCHLNFLYINGSSKFIYVVKKNPTKNNFSGWAIILFYINFWFLFCYFLWYNWKRQTIVKKVCFRLTLTFNQVYS